MNVAQAIVDRPITYRLNSVQNPMIALRYSLAPQAGEDPKARLCKATVQILPTGGAGGNLRVTVRLYKTDENNSTPTVHQTYNIDGQTVGTLKALVDELNKIPNLVAYETNALSTTSVNSSAFVALPETEIRTDGKYLNVLTPASSATVAYLRIGNPQPWDQNAIKLRRLYGLAVGVASGNVLLYRDVPSQGPVELLRKTLLSPLTDYVEDDAEEAQVYQCPLVLQVISSNLSSLDFNVVVTQASI